jgi:hypothetical protein
MLGANMLKIETYTRPEISAQVWKLTISDYELVQLDFTPQEKSILEKCNEPGAPISMVALGLALLARKIESQASSAPNTAPTGQAAARLPVRANSKAACR